MLSADPHEAIAQLDHTQLLERVRMIVERNMVAVDRTRSLVAHTDSVLRRQRPACVGSGTAAA